MSAATRRALWWLGAAQCVYWGLLYYGFAVLLVPIERALALPRPLVAGAFSLALLLMALAAPRVGHWLDRGHAATVFHGSAVLATAGLVMLAFARDAVGLYLSWALLGLAMAGLLYESAFGLVIRAIAMPAERLRALAIVSVAGGLASTIFLPLMAWAVAVMGWRGALALFAAAVVTTAGIMARRVLPVLRASVHEATQDSAAAPRLPGLLPVHLVFATGTLAATGLTTLLIPLLIERGDTATVAAWALAALGLMQLPGRLWLLRTDAPADLTRLVTWPLALQALGLAMVALAGTLLWAVLGVALFGLGAGLHTLARPWLVQSLYGAHAAGRGNGRVARVQGIARALGPVIAAALAARFGLVPVFLGLAALLALGLPMAVSLARRTHAH